MRSSEDQQGAGTTRSREDQPGAGTTRSCENQPRSGTTRSSEGGRAHTLPLHHQPAWKRGWQGGTRARLRSVYVLLA